MSRPQISFAGAIALAITTLVIKASLPYPSLMAKAGFGAGWLLVLLSAVWAAVGITLLGLLMARFAGQSLPAAVAAMTGPIAGPVLNLGLTVWLLLDAASMHRLFVEAFLATLLHKTPPSVLSLLALAVAVYAGYLGIEAIARANLLVFPFLTATFAIVLIFNLPEARSEYLLPFWGPGPAALIGKSLLLAGYMRETVLLAIYNDALRGLRTMLRAGLWALAICAVALAAMVAIYLANFGAAGAAAQPYPFYNLARLVHMGRLVQRAESILLLFWIMGAAVRLSVMLHATAVTLAAAIKVPFYRPLLLPLATLVFALSIVPENFLQAVQLQSALATVAAIPAFALPALLFIAVWVRRKEVSTVGR